MVFRDTSPSASWSGGFLNKVAIPCSNNLSLDFLACHGASSISFDLTTMTFLCFSGALPTSLVALPMDPVVLSKVYSIALSTMKKTQEPPENTLYCHTKFTGETQTAQVMISIT